MANVLKGSGEPEKADAAREVTGLAGFNLSDLADEGRSHLEQCRAQIRDMLAQARQEADEIRKSAEEEGYQAGLQRAEKDIEQRIRSEAENRARDGLQWIHQAVEQMHQTHQGWMQQYTEVLTKIAVAAAERIVRKRLTDEPDLLVRWADEALRSTRSANRLTLAVHPETLAKLGTAFDQLLATSDLPEQTCVEPDESVALNEVVVRQDGGEIVAGMQAQIQRLEELLS